MTIKRILISHANRTILVLLSLLSFVISAQAQTRMRSVDTGTPMATSSNQTTAAKTQSSKPSGSDSDQIEDIISYRANDSIILHNNGTAFLHGQAEINYQSIKLEADFVKVKIDSSLIYAAGTKGEDDEMIGEPIFSEGEAAYNSKELRYNLRTKKGYIKHVVTQEGEGYIISEDTKKSPDNVFSIKGGKYTTCDNHEHPHFYLDISKGKIKPGSYIVTGPAHLVIADVPLPVAIPFGFFPFTDTYSSGILMPSYTDEMTRGFGLTNGGYYFAISDYMDLELKGDIYTKGTWALSGATNYVKRYKYRGNLNVSYREDVTGEKGLPDYNKANNMSIRWSHSQDQKANPNFTFSSSVNFSTSGYNRSNVNSYYRPELNSENTKSSSINFTKRFPRLTSLNLSGGVNVTQRTKDSTINLSLPNLNISYSRFYPLKRKNPVGKERWYEKISMSYSGAFANSIQTKENKLLTSSFTRDWRNGMKHSIPVSASFNVLKHINISPSFNYTERWYLRAIEQSWDEDNNRVLNDTTDGFYRVYDFNMGISASTKLYGFYIPMRSLFGDKVDRIRHVITPSLGFSYTPDFGDSMWGYYDSYMRDGNEVIYSRFAGSLYGSPGRGTSGSINYSLGNNLEMKVRNDKDTTSNDPFKKISLIDNLSFSGSYNLAADSMRWSMISSSIRLKLSKSYSLSLSTSFDPYLFALNSNGNPVRVNQLRWNHGKFPKFQGTSTSYSYTFNNETFRKLFGRESKKGDTSSQDDTTLGDDIGDENYDGQSGDLDDGLGGNQNQPKAKAKTVYGDDGYSEVAIPWSLSFNYSIRYGNTNEFDVDKMEYKMDFTHNFSVNGNISLTPKWQISGNATYDFKVKQFTYTSVSVRRDLHCWNMSANIVPFGAYKSYNFHIGVNASMLSDLKYDKRSEYGVNRINWY